MNEISNESAPNQDGYPAPEGIKQAQSTSPTAKQISSSQFNFSMAIKHLLNGKTIHKLEWEDKKYVAKMDGEILKLVKPDGSIHNWILCQGDLEGDDYVVIE